MHGLFHPIDQVDLADVEVFLTAAVEEGLTWEAKADEDDKRQRTAGEAPGQLGAHTIRKAVCGFANAIGGYLIVGARSDRKTGAWSLPGVQIADPEPEGYLRRIIDSGLRPTPRYRPKVWRLDDGSVVALIEVEPIAEPPCITSGGQVYERVSGETRKVTDPAHLDTLLSRGRHARSTAENRADGSAKSAADAFDLGEGHGAVAIGMAPVARETDDIASKIFVPSFGAALEAALKRILPKHPAADEAHLEMIEGAIVAQAAYAAPLGPEDDWETPVYEREMAMWWAIGARWDGSVVAAAAFDSEQAGYISIIDEVIAPAWAELVVLVERIGGYGPTRLTIRLVGAGPPEPGTGGTQLLGRLARTIDVKRPIELAPATGEQLGSIQREIQRATGLFAWEPEPDVEPTDS